MKIYQVYKKKSPNGNEVFFLIKSSVEYGGIYTNIAFAINETCPPSIQMKKVNRGIDDMDDFNDGLITSFEPFPILEDNYKYFVEIVKGYVSKNWLLEKSML